VGGETAVVPAHVAVRNAVAQVLVQTQETEAETAVAQTGAHVRAAVCKTVLAHLG
jgi:hypothetical protein